MESHVTDLLKQVMVRLDQVHAQQSQTQNLLDEKLSEMTVKLEQEKIFMRDQLREAENEILRRLLVILGQGEGAMNVIPTSVSETNQVSHQMTESTVDLSNVINETRDKLQILDDRTNLMKTQITDTEQTCYNLTSWSQKIETLLENKITELVCEEKKKLKTITDVVKGQTRSELVQLDNRITKMLTDSNTPVNLKLEQLIRQSTESADQNRYAMDILIKQQEKIPKTMSKLREAITDMLNKQNQVVVDLQAKTERVCNSICDMDKQHKTSVENILRESKEFNMKLDTYFNNSTDTTNYYEINSVLEKQLTLVVHTLKREFDVSTDTLKAEVKTSTDTLKTEVKTSTDTLKREFRESADTLKTEIRIRTDTPKTEVRRSIEKLQKELETRTEKITKVTDTTKEDLLKHLTNSEAVQSESFSKCTGEIKTLITSLTKNLDRVKENMTVAVKKIENMETSLNDGHENINRTCDDLTQGQEQVRIKIEQTKNNIKEYIYKTKREIFAVTEKEAQIVRDRIEGPLPSCGKYTFDFYIENFKDLVRSEKNAFSPPWHINEMTSCVMGRAHFLSNGKVLVSLIHGRHPREVGLQPRSGTRLKVKASICDVYSETLPTLDLGEETVTMDENIISGNGDWWFSLSATSCDDLIKKGYGMKEGYRFEAVLIRFDVTVL